MREVVRELRADRIHLEPEMRLDDIDAADANLASPERVDAARDDDLLGGREIRMHRARRVGDAQSIDDDAALASALDLYGFNINIAAEARLECFLDPQANQSGETRRPEVPPAAADDQRDEDEEADRGAAHPLEAAPHRAAPLPLPRGAVP